MIRIRVLLWRVSLSCEGTRRVVERSAGDIQCTLLEVMERMCRCLVSQLGHSSPEEMSVRVSASVGLICCENAADDGPVSALRKQLQVILAADASVA